MKQFFILSAILLAAFNLAAQNDTVQQTSAVQNNIPQQKSQTPNDLFRQANEAYSKGDFQTAAGVYEELLKANGESAIVYYNLGNSYYKLNKIAPSILNYERALLLEPGNTDIRFNLEMSKLKTVDKIEPVGNFFLTDWFRSIQNLLSTGAWSSFSIICFILLIACLFLFFFSRLVLIKKLGFYFGIALLVGVILGTVSLIIKRKN